MKTFDGHGSLLTREEAATILGLKPQTLAAWACRRKGGLSYVKVGSRVRYRLCDLTEFVERETVTFESTT